jgi:hypothetical protein
MRNSTEKLIKRYFYLKSYFLFPKFTNTIPLQSLSYQTHFIITKEKKKKEPFFISTMCVVVLCIFNFLLNKCICSSISLCRCSAFYLVHSINTMNPSSSTSRKKKKKMSYYDDHNFINTLFSWSLQDIFNQNLHQNKVSSFFYYSNTRIIFYFFITF